MIEEVIKFLSVYLLTMLKFIAGPTLGYASGFSLLETIIVTVAGAMTSVLLFTFLGKLLKEKIIDRFFKRKKLFTKRNRRFIRIWRRYGVIGVTCLTPLIFTPIGGTLLLMSFGSPKNKVIYWMFIWSVFWSVFFSTLIYFFGPHILPGY